MDTSAAFSLPWAGFIVSALLHQVLETDSRAETTRIWARFCPKFWVNWGAFCPVGRGPSHRGVQA